MADVTERTLYDTDYYAWTRQQAAELRKLAERRANLPLDLTNLAEEVEDLGKSEERTVRSRIRRIVEHLLKLEFSRAAEPRAGWQKSVIEARDDLLDAITPTLRRDAEALLPRLYEQGRRRAAAGLREFGEHEAARALPDVCPYPLDRICQHDWYPANRHGLGDESGGA